VRNTGETETTETGPVSAQEGSYYVYTPAAGNSYDQVNGAKPIVEVPSHFLSSAASQYLVLQLLLLGLIFRRWSISPLLRALLFYLFFASKLVYFSASQGFALLPTNCCLLASFLYCIRACSFT